VELLPPTELVATDVGPLLFPADDQVMRPIIARTGEWEPNDARLFASFLRRGATVLDVGAHVGYYTMLASRAVGWRGRVVAVEPHPGNAALLRVNVARNRRRNVRVVEAAAWSESTRLRLREDATGNSGDHRIAHEGLEVDGVRVDDLLTRLDVAKIDAQGTDHRAVQGMTRLIEACRPVLHVEFWPYGMRAFGDEPASAVELYRSLGYHLSLPGVQADFDAWTAENYVELAESLPGGFATLVCRPS
jgi:FkbM family methyltransferase